MEKTFNSITELVHDPVFIQKVADILKEQQYKRLVRPEPKPGFRYIRDWYDRMSSEGHLNAKFFIDNIEAIWNKKSTLSSEYRNVIDAVCSQAFQAAHEYYKDLPEPVEKPKRTRKKAASLKQ